MEIGGETVARIGGGLLVFVGVGLDDGEEDVEYLAGKLVRLRIFDDAQGVMNPRRAPDGRRAARRQPVHAAGLHAQGQPPELCEGGARASVAPLYERFVARVGELAGREVATGRFGADMQVALVNDGPVTIWMDSKNRE